MPYPLPEGLLSPFFIVLKNKKLQVKHTEKQYLRGIELYKKRVANASKCEQMRAQKNYR